jgi:hypothetical protein
MARRFGVTFDTTDPAAEAAFWVEALGYRDDGSPAADAPEDERTWAAIADPDGTGPALFFQRVPEGKAAKNRVHLDLAVGGEGTPAERRTRIDAERDRLLALGATDHRGVHDDGESYWIRMNDPEGNEFCLV